MTTLAPSGHSIIPLEYDVFIGLDVDKHSMAATMTDHYGFTKSMKIPYDQQALVQYTSNHFKNKRVAFAYEAGPTGYGLYDSLQAAGYKCLVVSPSKIPVPRGSRVKTNRLDSGQISRLMQGGQLNGIRVPTPIYRELRQLTNLRNMHIRQVSAMKCRIKAMFLMEGISFPYAPAGSHWSLRVLNELAHMQCSTVIRFKLDQLLETLSFHQHQALEAQRQIRRLCMEDKDIADSIRYLTSIPGIGWIVASNITSRVGDWRGLRNSHELGAFLGLVPTEHSTGERVSKGSLTHSGDSRVRSMLIEAAWSAIRQDQELASFYHRVYQHHPRDRAARKAIVAVARKLTERMYCVLTERREYVLRPKEEMN
jgi:transposase